MATHSSILAWEIPWTGEPGGLQLQKGRKRVGHDLAAKLPPCEIYQQSWNCIISRVSSRSKILISKTPRMLCSYFSKKHTPSASLSLFWLCQDTLCLDIDKTYPIPFFTSLRIYCLNGDIVILFKIGLQVMSITICSLRLPFKIYRHSLPGIHLLFTVCNPEGSEATQVTVMTPVTTVNDTQQSMNIC